MESVQPPKGKSEYESPDDSDMETGNGKKMPDAAAIEYLPHFRSNSFAVA
jgi:hypothetical protein